jgi:sugar-specific transcriptional regulator TrmB
MDTDPTDHPHPVAIDQLEQFGLSSYAAQTFVALTSLGAATARNVNQTPDVPRTRVYDAVDELHDWGHVVVITVVFTWRLQSDDEC